MKCKKLLRLVAAGSDPMIEHVDDEGGQNLARGQEQDRIGGRQTTKKERKLGKSCLWHVQASMWAV